VSKGKGDPPEGKRTLGRKKRRVEYWGLGGGVKGKSRRNLITRLRGKPVDEEVIVPKERKGEVTNRRKNLHGSLEDLNKEGGGK